MRQVIERQIPSSAGITKGDPVEGRFVKVFRVPDKDLSGTGKVEGRGFRADALGIMTVYRNGENRGDFVYQSHQVLVGGMAGNMQGAFPLARTKGSSVHTLLTLFGAIAAGNTTQQTKLIRSP